MLQTYSAPEQTADDDSGSFLTPAYFYDLLKRRLLYFLIPFVLVAAIGVTVVMMIPAVYRAEGKILVESQQIPSDLVRSTVNAVANERIQVIEQRIMTRENLLAIANKYSLFTGRRERLTASERIDFIRERASIKPLALRIPSRRENTGTIAFTVGFEHETPAIAMRVANEFVTMILAEDVRVRTAFAAETTRFLERETKRLESELSSVETKMSDLKRQQVVAPQSTTEIQLVALRAELLQKAATYSESHPDMKVIKQKIASLEKTITKPKELELGLEALERQQAGLQRSLESASQKLGQARLGENLERGQQSERLEVIEQPTMPQKPVRPNREKFLALVIAGALAFGGGLVLLLEMLQSTINRSTDLLRVADGHMIVSIPYITTKAEIAKRKRKIIFWVLFVLSAIAAAAGIAVLVLPPLDIVFNSLLVKLGI